MTDWPGAPGALETAVLEHAREMAPVMGVILTIDGLSTDLPRASAVPAIVGARSAGTNLISDDE